MLTKGICGLSAEMGWLCLLRSQKVDINKGPNPRSERTHIGLPWESTGCAVAPSREQKGAQHGCWLYREIPIPAPSRRDVGHGAVALVVRGAHRLAQSARSCT